MEYHANLASGMGRENAAISQTRAGPNPQHEVKSVTDTGKRKWTKLGMHPRPSVAGNHSRAYAQSCGFGSRVPRVQVPSVTCQ
ncbi:MAG: hypothetical protein QOH31_6715 [Verrucomicrobiota bacterium]|jgi:hypothetical protein